MIHAERTEQGTVHCTVKGSGKSNLLEHIAVMAHMGSLIARKTGCTPEEALDGIVEFTRILMRDREPGGEEARLS